MSSAIPFSPLSPKSGLRYAASVGRVGALAVALGVGFAVASTPGVAHADGSTNSSQSSDGTTAGSTDAKDATAKADSSNDRRQTRMSERIPTLRAFSVAASNPARVAAASGARTRVTARKDLDHPAPPLVSAPRVHTDRYDARSLSSTQS